MKTLIIDLKKEFVPRLAWDQCGFWTTPASDRVLLCHANEAGDLSLDDVRVSQDEVGTAIVVSCYPRAVQAKYPSARVVGDWDSPTDAYIFVNKDISVLRVREAAK